jgi:hypothetical protein
MKATGIIARFVSLLDIALILLGLLMIVLTQAQMPTASHAAGDAGQAAADVDFVYLIAGSDQRRGRVYQLGPDSRVGAEVRTDNSSDIDRLKSASTKTNQVFILLYSEKGWYPEWDDKRRAALDKAWNTRIVHIYNVKLPDST